jgi:hypothetical protein
MPYGRRTYRRRRYPGRGRRFTRSNRRYRAPLRSGRFRRRRTGVSRRRILNLTSKKKQDNRLQANYIGNTWVPVTSYGILASTITVSLYAPTVMDRDTPNPLANLPSFRDSQVCYMRGYKENVTLVTADESPWQWRRICFTMKGPSFVNQSTIQDGIAIQIAPQGYVRPFINVQPTLRDALYGYVFKGQDGRDWNDPFLAKVDTQRITLKSDITRTMHPNGEGGFIKSYHLWHPMNRNLIYNEDESGTDVLNFGYSALGKAGMGDYYIMDLFRSNQADSSAMQIQMAGTLYWHEK